MPKYNFKIQTLASASVPSLEMLSCDLFAETLQIADGIAESIYAEWGKVAPKIMEPYNRTPVVQISE